MNVTIDAAGRIVVPEDVRRRLGLVPGTSLSLTLEEDRLILQPASPPMRLEEATRRIEVADDAEMPALTAEDVRAALERTRR